jgi:16S rRNA processing protein RimM
MEEIKFISIGKIIGIFGKGGEVKVELLTDFPERFKKLKKVYLEDKKGIQELNIENVSFRENFVIIKFSEIENIKGAKKLLNKYIKVDKKNLVKLKKGQYYYFEIIGMDVETTEGKKLGKIKEIIKTGSNDVYVVENEEKGEILIPGLKEVVKEIDLKNKIMKVSLLKGILNDEV